MRKSLVSSLLLVTALVIAGAGCATAPKPEGAAATRPEHPTTFETWAVGNGTGSFFRPVGPAGGTGVRSSW